MRRYLPLILLACLLSGCGSSASPVLPPSAPEAAGPDFPLGTPQNAPTSYPTVETPAAINLLATLTPAAMAATSGCAGCDGMTLVVTGASYPGYGNTFNGTFHFVKQGPPESCFFLASNGGTWQWMLRPSSQFGGWELIGQQFFPGMVIYHTSTDPSQGGTGWTSTNFQLVFSLTGESVPRNLTIDP